MKWFFSAALSVVALSALAWYFSNKPTSVSVSDKHTTKAKAKVKDDERLKELQRLKVFGGDIKSYAKNGGYNNRYCFLIDMKRPSGSNRFFIYDMKKDSVIDEGLVAHGGGRDATNSITFSNKPNSLCTSLGKYKIGASYNGSFGLAYKLYGLDKTNDQAFNRFVVLHGHSCVPDEEVAPGEICTSWGCPTVSPSFLTTIAGYIDQSDKPMLMWIFN